MTATLQQAKRFAQLKSTKVIEAPGGYRISDDHQSITFVLESGPKLTMTGKELDEQIAVMEKALAKQAAILELDQEEPKPKKVKEKGDK